jgi:hypothetical protein
MYDFKITRGSHFLTLAKILKQFLDRLGADYADVFIPSKITVKISTKKTKRRKK